MRIFADKLAEHLERKQYPIYLVMGNEPLLLQESRDLINKHAKSVGFFEKQRFVLDKQLDWNDVFDCCQALSLFSNQQVIELEIPEAGLSAAAAKELITLSGMLNPDILLVVVSNKALSRAQENTKWFKALHTNGVLVSCNSPELRQLPQFVQLRCRKLKLVPDAEAIQMLAQWHEGNLLALAQSLEKLALIYPDGKLTLPRVEAALSRHNHFTPFQWTDALLAGQAKRAQRILRQLHAEGQEAIILLRTLQKELFLLLEMKQSFDQKVHMGKIFDQYRIWQNKRPMYTACLQRLNAHHIQRQIHSLTQLELSVKTTFDQDPWPQLSQISIEICQPSARIPNNNHPHFNTLIG
ncbi:DNA polymerase III subunit delta [Vibrio rumoiensis]|uniref:DNA polymerase III subunit delta n=1 Tax=Vibrio rumoiensis 1S-45 TaxID=1188252 RepID=A0A1E5E3B1_9VIBR|nr:DNA polymerase III subunit delta [Vibrio rumoiensis]OEF26274.1 DNA polymerase III subunit delta [Vibrio rumoiensis 1S-45]